MTAARWVPALFERVKTPLGTGTVLSLATEWNGFYYEDNRVKVGVWYGVDGGPGWTFRTWPLNELEPMP